MSEVTTSGGVVGTVELIDHMGDELKIANAARCCRGQHKDEFDKKSETLIGVLIDLEHLSVFEHATLTYKISCPIFTRTHLFRYRTASPTELSGRMKHADIGIWMPCSFRNCEDNESAQTVYKTAVAESVGAYRKLIELGVPAEQARAILPQGTITTFLYTIDLRNFMHIWKERTGNGVQEETKAVVMEMARQIAPLYPTVAKKLGWPV